MGRRGCPDCSTLDLDLKARHVSTEELMYSLGANLMSSGPQSVASEHFLTFAPWYAKMFLFIAFLQLKTRVHINFNHSTGGIRAVISALCWELSFTG